MLKYFIVLLCLLPTLQAINVLNLKKCEHDNHSIMEFYVCKVHQYEKYYFEDAAGINQITIIPNRLYSNHAHLTAYSTENKLYIGKKLYKNTDWFRFKESLSI